GLRAAGRDGAVGDVVAVFLDGTDVAHVPGRVPVVVLPTELQVGLPTRDRAVVDFDAHRALRRQAEFVDRAVLDRASGLQRRAQLTPAHLRTDPVGLKVEAAGLDRAEVLQRVDDRREVAALIAGSYENRAGAVVEITRPECANVGERLDVSRLDR